MYDILVDNVPDNLVINISYLQCDIFRLSAFFNLIIFDQYVSVDSVCMYCVLVLYFMAFCNVHFILNHSYFFLFKINFFHSE